jgi:hypothetical protein
MRTSNLGLKLSGLLTIALALGLMLSACGGTETITSAGGTIAAGGGTVIAGGASGAGTAIAGGASGAGTAIAGGASGAGTAIAGGGTAVAGGVGTAVAGGGTVVAGGASGAGTAVAGGGTAIAGGAGTAVAGGGTAVAGGGTAVSGALTPGATPTPAGALTPAAGANALPMAQGATKITLSDADRNLIQGQFQPFAAIVNQPTYDFYKITGQANNSAINTFYTNEMTRLGWSNRSNDLGAVANFANLNFAGVKPLVFTKGNQIAVVGVSNPLTTETITSAGLSSQFKPGDIAIMAATGTLKIAF